MLEESQCLALRGACNCSSLLSSFLLMPVAQIPCQHSKCQRLQHQQSKEDPGKVWGGNLSILTTEITTWSVMQATMLLTQQIWLPHRETARAVFLTPYPHYTLGSQIVNSNSEHWTIKMYLDVHSLWIKAFPHKLLCLQVFSNHVALEDKHSSSSDAFICSNFTWKQRLILHALSCYLCYNSASSVLMECPLPFPSFHQACHQRRIN